MRRLVGPCVGRSRVIEGQKSSNDIIKNDTMSDDEVVASYVPPRYLFYNFLYVKKIFVKTGSGCTLGRLNEPISLI